MEKNLTASKVANQLDISVTTLNHWYGWYRAEDIEKPEGVPPLPDYNQQGINGTRYWSQEDVEMLRKFKEWMPKGRAGIMGNYNARFWGKRGKEIQARKGL